MPSNALLLGVVVVAVLLLAVALAPAPRGCAPPREKLCGGPHNIGLYDAPYEHYPRYEGRGALWWDGDRRCQASCSQSPCTIWCR